MGRTQTQEWLVSTLLLRNQFYKIEFEAEESFRAFLKRGQVCRMQRVSEMSFI